jgi:hypothetical protein
MKQGDEFRDTVAKLLQVAGYEVQTEVLVAGKTVDMLASRRIQFGDETIALEVKDYAGNLPLHETSQFVFEYGNLTRDVMRAAQSWLRAAHLPHKASWRSTLFAATGSFI